MPKRRKRLPTDATPVPEAGASAAGAAALHAGFQATTAQVQAMHNAISGKTFDALQLLPGLSVPTRFVQGAHDAITTGVYAAMRHGSNALLSLAGDAERLFTGMTRLPEDAELAVRSALNAAAGDALAQAGSPLAVQMGFHANGASVPLEPADLADLRPRLCIFIHGLACDEHSWSLFPDAWADSPWAGKGVNYGTVLAHELGISALYLRYNTGLAIAENGRLLALQLTRLLENAPARVRDVVLIGHSMGGLVARSACDRASQEQLAWLSRVSTLISIGSPNQGAPMEKLGQFVATMLSLSNVTQPLGEMANVRSQGIEDLQHGLPGKRRRKQAAASPALRFIAGSLADEKGSTHGMGAVVGSVLGDGLVSIASASDEGLTGDVQRVELQGLGHMTLLNHPRVYAVIRDWLQN